MSNQELENYVNSRRLSGIPDDEIAKELSDVGWTRPDIEESLRFSRLSNSSTVKHTRHWHGKYLRGKILVIAGLSAYIGFQFAIVLVNNGFITLEDSARVVVNLAAILSYSIMIVGCVMVLQAKRRSWLWVLLAGLHVIGLIILFNLRSKPDPDSESVEFTN